MLLPSPTPRPHAPAALIADMINASAKLPASFFWLLFRTEMTVISRGNTRLLARRDLLALILAASAFFLEIFLQPQGFTLLT